MVIIVFSLKTAVDVVPWSIIMSLSIVETIRPSSPLKTLDLAGIAEYIKTKKPKVNILEVF